nr:immunoglobulin light chain junction region [Macaca mulatta]MOW07893.1 immunoglobulin light chain junction region [Macaca mulatta]MOW07985.1 immunoglobulin light chain junction region [Macaca mulatta]MOW08037.1 immunoglobulin light chain junction region [Macaca mulatta]MOW08040.1 immunoglobulin light chain junction region [Macaca mulatta]
CMQATELWTF